MTSSNVPKFGDWESEENVAYTAYFEKAGKVQTSGGNKMTKPRGPEEGTSPPKPGQEEAVKICLDRGETSGNKKQGKSVSNSYEKSPLHKNSYDGTGKSKHRTNHKGEKSRDTVVPKFGDWDEKYPASTGYTHIFDQVREERTSGPNVTSSSRTSTHSSGQKSSDRYKFCCFPWGRK
ncbi:hypothetical protein AALP_AA7G167300 [Arabis alpina]|uniref:RIN4 pathogenic type III effector avirulence factor Avr cleavage site domain-containing protein n=1 Tax=Arabis alpina TaxID=50452 RepID=A0A087GIJ6_ARAAL|nr:hypothetical protein AALP_AA7G167300 [Arabis alpina]